MKLDSKKKWLHRYEEYLEEEERRNLPSHLKKACNLSACIV